LTTREPSRCVTPQDALLNWAYCREEGADPVGDAFRVCVNGAAPSERMARYGELKQRLNAAARGELNLDPSVIELKEVARDPTLWEIRWSLGGVPWRLYHGEPAVMPRHLLALHFHQKVTEGDDAAIKHAQNQEIDVATLRYVRGAGSRWGVP